MSIFRSSKSDQKIKPPEEVFTFTLNNLKKGMKLVVPQIIRKMAGYEILIRVNAEGGFASYTYERVRDHEPVPQAEIDAMLNIAQELEKFKRSGELHKDTDVWKVVQQLAHCGATESTDANQVLATLRDINVRRKNMKKNMDELHARLGASNGDHHAHALYEFCMDQFKLLEGSYKDIIKAAVLPGAQPMRYALHFTTKGITSWFLNTMFTDSEQMWAGKTTIHECIMGNSPMIFKRGDIDLIPSKLKDSFLLLHLQASEYMTHDELQKWSTELSVEAQNTFNAELPLLLIDPRIAEKVKEFSSERATKYSSIISKIKTHNGSMRLANALDLLVRRMIIARFVVYDEEIKDMVKLHDVEVPKGTDISLCSSAKKLFEENKDLVKKLFILEPLTKPELKNESADAGQAAEPVTTKVTPENDFEISFKAGLRSSSVDQKDKVMGAVRILIKDLESKLVEKKNVEGIPSPVEQVEIPRADESEIPAKLKAQIDTKRRKSKKQASYLYEEVRKMSDDRLSDEVLFLVGTVARKDLQKVAMSYALAKLTEMNQPEDTNDK